VPFLRKLLTAATTAVNAQFLDGILTNDNDEYADDDCANDANHGSRVGVADSASARTRHSDEIVAKCAIRIP